MKHALYFAGIYALFTSLLLNRFRQIRERLDRTDVDPAAAPVPLYARCERVEFHLRNGGKRLVLRPRE